ncbi:MAG: SRPBCC family protein [Flavobacteriaceae bacterium]
MKLYQLYSSQALPISASEAWKFLSNPANLSVITPQHMGFKIIRGGDEPMYPGQIIHYKVSPYKGITTNWVTEITHVKEGEYFVDEQRFGPYSLWHHKHFIRPGASGVLMEDLIDYKLPLGVLGQMMHSLLVKKQLRQIFKYRENKLKELFGIIPDSSNKFSIS